ncbi:wax ester/triacylglycerol synthase family O-acyltransferase [Actinophytocola sp. NPDC049390]|uniref:wax ester/triacylglycerol synthase family O-acyltransferase n=1 Tax=Actinophytocola sp. NPDC049390 TaxID=3363894 RepID=UPI0037ABEDB3
MERLGPLDAAFLALEDSDRHASLAIASVAVLSGPAPGQEEYVAAIGPRFAAIRRARQRVLRVPFDLGAPVWADDPDFDVGYHFRRTAVPAPGDDEALHRLVARIMAQRLDRDRPLWECWVIEGLAGDRWAVLTKLHHCMADGVSGTRLYHAIFADTPAAAPTAAMDPAPGPMGLVLDAVGDLAWKAVGQAGVFLDMVRSPMRLIRGAAELAAAIRPTTPSSLSGSIGTARRYHVARVPLPAVVRVAKAYGTTVNDVVLTAISAGLRAILLSRGERPDPHTVRTLVPVSVRATGDLDELDNRISLLLPYLPVDIADPVDALAEVHRRLVREKATGEAEAGRAFTELAAREPFAPVSLAIRFAARLPQRAIVTVTTNVPGPRAPLHVLGRKVLELLPYVPIAVRLRLGVAVMTYCDEAVFAVTADFATMPDAPLVTDAIERTVAELVRVVDTGVVRPRAPRPASLSGSSHQRDG